VINFCCCSSSERMPRKSQLPPEVEQQVMPQSMTLSRAIFWLVTGLVLLVASSRILVWGAVNIAQELGVSELTIGLTIVALGTSLPELAASLAAARKGEHDLAVGNVVGSNMFNSLAVVGIAGAIEPISDVGAEIFWRDWSSVLFCTALLLFTAVKIGKAKTISRLEGGVFVLCYLSYNIYLIQGSVG
ncbi:sodium:calcium antiporter, partial [Vibrio diabolicus]|nr:calcium/sodium antiporter [Vibrio diabolicus]